MNVVFAYLNLHYSRSQMKNNIVEKKPVIMISPQVFQNSNKYIIRNKDSLSLVYQFQISNVGQTTAKNLRILPPILRGTNSGFSEQPIGPLEIPAKEKIFAQISIEPKLGESKEIRESFINSILNGQSVQYLTLTIEYFDDFNSGLMYKSISSFRYNHLISPELLSSSISNVTAKQ
jgi:hypothetical protein